MNFKQMYYFVEVAESGGFSKASYSLPLAQSALSRHIRLLEEEFDTKLLLRTGRGVKLTEQGEYLLEQAKDILDKKQEIERTLTAWYDYPSGVVKVGLPPTIVLSCSAQIIRAVGEEFPDISIQITEQLSKDIGDNLSAGRFDLGVVMEKRPQENVEAEMIALEELRLAVPNNMDLTGPVTVKDIANLPLIAPSSRGRLRESIELAAANENIKLTPTYTIDALHAMKELIQTGLGVAVLPVSAIAPEVSRGEIKSFKIAAKNMMLPVYLAYSSGQPQGRAAAAVAKIMKTVLGDNLKKKIDVQHA